MNKEQMLCGTSQELADLVWDHLPVEELRALLIKIVDLTEDFGRDEGAFLRITVSEAWKAGFMTALEHSHTLPFGSGDN